MCFEHDVHRHLLSNLKYKETGTVQNVMCVWGGIINYIKTKTQTMPLSTTKDVTN